MMKFKLLAVVGLCGFILGACGVDNTENKAQETSRAALVEKDNSKESEPKKDSKLVEKGELLEAGQYKNDNDLGKLELIKIASPGNQVEVAPNVFVTFGNVKIINFVDIPESFQETANAWYGFEGNQGYDLQFDYTVENKNDFKIDNAAVGKVILSDGEQIERFMYSDETLQLEAGSKASNQLGHVAIPHSDISSVKFYIDPVDFDTYDSLGSQPVEVKFD
ncbi:hypothetical protein JHE06_05215 [Carnobacterium sp. CS13]|uniref:hypothetical protein n=1 Tax=Carnobacterium sp. CS13 TaxID=2800128 RepID=UPI001914ABBD|nr:hypothetical protein [Carnobacterium sp. CS13]QQP71170.1 hypothetical protein JHE06_05215 [Carnobacterium sp. CS13]